MNNGIKYHKTDFYISIVQFLAARLKELQCTSDLISQNKQNSSTRQLIFVHKGYKRQGEELPFLEDQDM